MPKNIQEELLERYNNAIYSNENIKASLNKNKQENVNGLFEMIYGRQHSNVAIEKTRVFNEFFADLFDLTNIKWIIRWPTNKGNKLLEDIFKKYLREANLPGLGWVTKFRSGIHGRYALVVVKQVTRKIFNNMAETRPILIPARVSYKNTINNNIFEIEVLYDDYPLTVGKESFILKKKYKLNENQVSVDTSLLDFNKNKNIDTSLMDANIQRHLEENNEKTLLLTLYLYLF